jgi:acetylornithine deacetylase/succinyl-diaminopimelate desuccinylase-like protein
MPGERREDAIPAVAAWLQERLDFPVTHEAPYVFSPPLDNDRNGPLSDRLLASIAAAAGPHRKIGVAYGTHASRVAQAGVPAVVFGPGDIAQAHTEDEWIDLEQLQQATDIYAQFAVDMAKL